MSSNTNPYEVLTNDLDRIKKKQKFTKKLINDKIDEVLQYLKQSNDKLSEMNANDKKIEQKQIKNEFQTLHNNLSNCKPLQNILSSHKDYFAYISKLGKDIDKNFNSDINEAFEPVELDKELIKALISEHFIREGKFELEEIFNEEAGFFITTEFREAFKKLHQILLSLKNKDLSLAIEWVENQPELSSKDNKLLFGMHKLQFASILVKDGRDKAIQYARNNFPKFSKYYQGEIQKLMASILFKEKISDSPYKDFYDEKNWVFIEDLIIQETCKIMKKSPDCSLFASVTAGTLALPKFLKFSSVSSNKTDWKDKTEIPIEIEIGKDFKYHSIFVCPVSKEISTPQNPPMLLKCGHVISQHSLKKMSNNNNKTKFKCPTCPTEQTLQQVHEIHF